MCQVTDSDLAVFHVSKTGDESVTMTLRSIIRRDASLFLYHRIDLERDVINCRYFYRVSSEGSFALPLPVSPVRRRSLLTWM